IFHPKTRVDVKDETRLKATSEEVEKYAETLNLKYEPRFPTECFFMTIHAIHIGLNPIVQSIKRVKRHQQQLQQNIKEIEAQMVHATGLKRDRLAEKLKFQKNNRDRIVRTLLCMECTLRDRSILDRILMFSDRQLSFLISMVNPE
uniref:Ubiquitin conjugation factor E4 core domain-containing protein n=1 Tax=Panagrolaimus sp. ES5 TaxID=591445 RepID=A0AC34GK73_9BILA